MQSFKDLNMVQADRTSLILNALNSKRDSRQLEGTSPGPMYKNSNTNTSRKVQGNHFSNLTQQNFSSKKNKAPKTGRNEDAAMELVGFKPQLHNQAVSSTIGTNERANFFSSKNRKLYAIYNTDSIERKESLSALRDRLTQHIDKANNSKDFGDQYNDYMRTLKEFNKQKNELFDDGKNYYMSPCRYVAGNKEIGDIRVPWKLVKRDASNSKEADNSARGHGQYLGNLNEINREGYSHAVQHSKHHLKKIKNNWRELKEKSRTDLNSVERDLDKEIER